MERITKAQITRIFEQWVKAIGGKVATSYNDKGGYRLDHNSVYGGWKIEQIMNDAGGVDDRVFGYYRMSNTNFYLALSAAIETIRQYEVNKAAR
jgi:hypothetical protein